MCEVIPAKPVINEEELMRTHRIARIALVAVVATVASAVAVRADQPPVTLSPDRILKGTTPTITITLDKSIPDQKEIKSVSIGGQVVAVQEPNADGKLSVPLPKLDIVGRAVVEVIGKDNKSVAIGQLTYVESAEAVGPSNKELALLIVYIGLIVLLPLICTIFDISKSYRERNKVFGKLLGDRATTEEIGALLAKMDQGPTGLVGLTRGLLALTLVLALAFAAFHLIVFAPAKVPDIADKLLMLLAGTLTAITGFYFGSKAATEAAQQQAQPSRVKTAGNGVPNISGVKLDGSGKILTVSGEGFGERQGKGTVKIGGTVATVTNSNWTDKQIEVAVPDGVHGDVDVVVTNDNGKSSDPKQTKLM
jgi:hypothetical protein